MKAIVFTLNGCHLAALGPYGNEWIATPNLDQLAAESATFDRHLSCCPDPIQARLRWISDSLLDQLQAAGVHTALLRNTRPENDGPPQFYAGWAELFDCRPDPTRTSPADPLLDQLPQVLESLQNREKWLLWIDCDRLLPPWDAPQDLFDIYVEDLIEEPQPSEAPPTEEASEVFDEFDEDEDEDDEEHDDESEDDEAIAPEPAVKESIPPWVNPPIGWFDQDDLSSWELLHRTYAAAVTAFDADLGKLFGLFRSHGLHESAIWFWTADRGFPLGEHGLIGSHRSWLHEELVHLPLIIRPTGQRSGQRIPAITQPIDFVQSLAKVFGVSLPEGMNLLDWLHQWSGPGRDVAISQLHGEQAIRTQEWTLLKPVPVSPVADDEENRREVQLFHYPDDRWEVNDIWRQHENTVEELLKQLPNG